MSQSDHQNVELVWITPNAEQLITKMARVSNPSNEDNMETAPRLLSYLIKHKHWSPFELGNMCIKISTERDISTQILRHRSFTFQEYSSRYSNMPMANVPEFRRQDLENRQNSIDDLDDELIDEMKDKAAVAISHSYNVYQELLDKGVAKECARRILPLCTPTTLYMNGTIRSWIHYIQLRSSNGTQLEHMEIANKIKAIFIEQLPFISVALQWN